jgi:hypothetical protein
LNKKQYLELCEACDNLLLSPNVKIERVAISWLHVIRAHPTYLRNYEILFNANPTSKKHFLVDSYIYIKYLFRFGIGSLKNNKIRTNFYPKDKNLDILFISHLVSNSHFGNEIDFYFGNLGLNLFDNGIKSSFALINHTSEPAENLTSKWKDSRIPRYILSHSLGFLQEVKLYFKSLLESIRLKKESRTLAFSLQKKVTERAAYEASIGGGIPSMRIGIQVSQLIRELNPRIVITTYEGYSFERIIYAEARKINPDIYCIGYQHAALFPMQHSLKRNLAPIFNPNAILSSGLVSFEQLKNSDGLQGISFSILGSNRVGFLKYKLRMIGPATCLVLPEGELSECLTLFKFSLACAKMCPDVKFIWRLHPLVTFRNIQKEFEELNNLPQNITLSSSSLEEDIEVSTCALYRGTTAIIQAINGGLIPIYYHTGEFVIDPIAEVNDSYFSVETISDFRAMIKHENLMDFSESSKLKNIRDYSTRVFTDYNLKFLLEKNKSLYPKNN